MWTYNTDYSKWYANDDSISKNDFDYLKQELKATRFYSRCLSGATYLPVNDLNNIYDILIIIFYIRKWKNIYKFR